MTQSQKTYANHLIDLTIEELRNVSRALQNEDFIFALMLLERFDIDVHQLTSIFHDALTPQDTKE